MSPLGDPIGMMLERSYRSAGQREDTVERCLYGADGFNCELGNLRRIANAGLADVDYGLGDN